MEESGKLPTSQSSFHDHPHTQESDPLAIPPHQQQQQQRETNEMNDDALDHHEMIGVGTEGYQGGLDDQVTGLPYPSLPHCTLCYHFCNLLSTDIL